MDNWTLVSEFAHQYVKDINIAKADSWDAVYVEQRNAKRMIRELNSIITAVDMLNRYGLTVS